MLFHSMLWLKVDEKWLVASYVLVIRQFCCDLAKLFTEGSYLLQEAIHCKNVHDVIFDTVSANDTFIRVVSTPTVS